MVAGLVSTIIPVYNRPILLREAVASVLVQTYASFEIILVDDGSDEETRQVCEDLRHDSRTITAIHVPHTGRAGLSREVGRLAAQGEFIQYLDSDDVLRPRKFEVMVNALRANPQADIAYCYTRRYRRCETPTDVACERTGITYVEMLPDVLAQRFWHSSTPLYTRRICDRAGAWSSLKYWEDVEYDLRLATLGAKLVHCREFLVDFRDHDETRLSPIGFWDDAACVRHAPAAYRLLSELARRSGASRDAPAMRVFIDEIRSAAVHCRRLGLEAEARECLGFVDRLLGEQRAEGPV